jgi:hypothetical protein
MLPFMIFLPGHVVDSIAVIKSAFRTENTATVKTSNFIEQAAKRIAKLGTRTVGMAPIIPTPVIRGVECNSIEMSSLRRHISCS